MLLREGDELALGGQYWMQDDTGDEVWRLGEVLDRGEEGNLSIKLESGGVIDIDPVRRVDVRQPRRYIRVGSTLAHLLHHVVSLRRARLL